MKCALVQLFYKVIEKNSCNWIWPKLYWGSSSDDVDISKLFIIRLCAVYKFLSGPLIVDFQLYCMYSQLWLPRYNDHQALLICKSLNIGACMLEISKLPTGLERLTDGLPKNLIYRKENASCVGLRWSIMYWWRLFIILQAIYQTKVPYDPEGILGTLTSIFLCFLGLQVNNNIDTYICCSISRKPPAWMLAESCVRGGVCFKTVLWRVLKVLTHASDYTNVLR